MPTAMRNDEHLKPLAFLPVGNRHSGPIPRGLIISDNKKQFTNNPFREWCEELEIKQKFTSVAHPQANGQTEVTNRTILQGLKTRLGKAKGHLVYGSEAVLSQEIGLPTYRISTFQPAMNDSELRLNLDLLGERREMASLWNARTRQAGKKDKGS
ncbi:reverse transcriptase domain-containing protein [Tanacetum coccineum]